MDPRLQQAIEHDDVDELHSFIAEEPKLLDRACKDPFPNTPLHVAAAAGKTQVAFEMAIMKPSFARKLNPEGYSPLHLALQHEHYQTARALIKFDSKLIRVRGRYGITPLHYVAEKEGDNELELLAEFLLVCESSIEDLTSRCETAIHVAVKNHNLKAFKVLFGWLKRVRLTRILDWGDQDGNTILHIAVFEEQLEIIKLLIGYTNVNMKNFQGKTALEIFRVNPDGNQDVAKRLRRQGFETRDFTPSLPLSQFYSRELSLYEKYAAFFGIRLESFWYIILAIYVVEAAMLFNITIILLGGYWQNSSLNPVANSSVVTANSSMVAIAKPRPATSWIPKDAICVLNIVFFLVCMGLIWSITMKLLPYARKVFWTIAFLVLVCFSGGFPEGIEVTKLSYGSFIGTHK